MATSSSLLLAVFVLVPWWVVQGGEAAPSPAEAELFTAKVQPLLERRGLTGE